MIGRRAPALLAAAGALFAGVALDRWCWSATSADVALALLFVAALFFAVYAWLEARCLA